MKIRLGNKSIKISSIQRVSRFGSRIAVLTFKNGESMKVVCGVKVPDVGIPCFSGTYEDLKSLIERLK
ncbi:MAG: hypothetical protein OXC79_02520 [Candidatus Poribacteria bacterium]|nr:hypothetical protein [Candidatus Poribacteria bacterium]